MYRYYSTQRPVAPGTYPGRPATLGNYGSNGTDIDYLGRVWGWLDYEDELTAEQADAYELKPAGQTPMYYAISETTARQAKRMNSFSDYVEGSATAGYRVEVDRAAYLAYRQKRRIDPMYHDRVDSLLNTYARKLAENLNANYSIQTRCPSILIAGGSNFPVSKKEKQNRAADRNMQEWKDIQGILDKIRSTGKGGISSDDPAAVTKLKTKLAKLEAAQQTMKDVNAYWRKHKTLKDCPYLTEEEIAKAEAAIGSDWHLEDKPFASYSLSNNNANIRRIKERITELEKRSSSAAPAGWEFDGGKVVMNTDENRIQVFFDEKPDNDTRTELRGAAFKWAPSQGAWQRQLTDNAIRAAKYLKCLKPTD